MILTTLFVFGTVWPSALTLVYDWLQNFVDLSLNNQTRIILTRSAMTTCVHYPCCLLSVNYFQVTRYQSDPGQATAYMIGQLQIKNARNYAKTELGDNFSLRDFHYQVNLIV